MSSEVLPQKISASGKIYPQDIESLGDSIALACASRRVPMKTLNPILAVAEAEKYILSSSGIQKRKFGQWQDDQICAVFSNSHVFVVFRYNTVQYAIWYALQMSSLVPYGTVPIRYGTRHCGILFRKCRSDAYGTVPYRTELRNVTSYQRTLR